MESASVTVGADAAARVVNQFWWIVVIVAILAVTFFASLCIIRGGHFGGYLVGGHGWFGTKIYIACQ